jgi:signal transduction histidine kinase
VNAAIHSGDPGVSLYAEVEDRGVEVFVRDRGRGFDLAADRGGRRGITQSIVGRLERIGGTAEIVSSPGNGVEVRLRVPLSARTDGSVTS